MQQVHNARFRRKYGVEEELSRYVGALYEMLAGVLGADKVVLRAGKVSALKMMRSQNLARPALRAAAPGVRRPDARTRDHARAAAQGARLRSRKRWPTSSRSGTRKTDRAARQREDGRAPPRVRQGSQARGAARERRPRDARLASQARRTLGALAGASSRVSALQQLRPQSLREIVGQEAAISALLAKISSPYPQHVILYGPPGVGKTTVARLALEVAKQRPHTPFAKDAPFVEASGTTLRWDPRETMNPLLGSVHDPIYQGSRRDLRRGGRSRAQARPGDAGARRRALHRRDRRDGSGAAVAPAQGARGQARHVRVVVLRRERSERAGVRQAALPRRRAGRLHPHRRDDARTRRRRSGDPLALRRDVLFSRSPSSRSFESCRPRSSGSARGPRAPSPQAHRLLYDRRPQGGADRRRRLRPGALPHEAAQARRAREGVRRSPKTT